ncbi:hypothetical protein BASA81_006583 [Batrachochytrium salamandrivorans]|nr:hypothetical protein BASA81_006583 [Batrachochytrium salamandrivorans]
MAYNPREDEAEAFKQLFNAASKNGKLQAIGGADAAVWTVASNGQKEMGPREFYTALRLIALAQQNPQQPITDSTLNSTMGVTLPLPKFQGVEIAASPPAATTTISWAITPEAKAQYEQLWRGLEKNSTTGLVEGRDVAQFFAKSGLDRDVLRGLWQLSDLTNDGAMDFKEFMLCMHMVMMVKKKNQPAPTSIPPELFQSVMGAAPPAQQQQQQQQPPPQPPQMNNLMNLSAFTPSSSEQPSFFNASRVYEQPLVPPPALTTSSSFSGSSKSLPIATSSNSLPIATSSNALVEETQLTKSQKQVEDARLLVSGQISRSDEDLALLKLEKDRLNHLVEEANSKHLADGGTLHEVEELVSQLKLALAEAKEAAAVAQAAAAQAVQFAQVAAQAATIQAPTALPHRTSSSSASADAFAGFALPPSPQAILSPQPTAASFTSVTTEVPKSANDGSFKRRAAPTIPSTRPASGNFAMADTSTPSPPQQPPPPPPAATMFDPDHNNPFGQ